MAYVITLPFPVGRSGSFTKNVSRLLDRPRTRHPHLCFAFVPTGSPVQFTGAYALGHLGLVFWKGNATSSFERRLAVHHVHAIDDPVSLEELETYLPHEHRVRIRQAVDAQESILSPGAVDALLSALASARPVTEDMVRWFRNSQREDRQLRTQEALVWRDERDAVNVGLALAGIDAGLAEHWTPPEGNQPFLAGLKPTSDESHLISHDARILPGWHLQSQHEQHIRVFTDGRQTIEVMNVHAGSVESFTGVDLIYYHLQTASLIMVQYKRLDPRSELAYADARFRKQIERMSRVNRLGKPLLTPSDWRFGTDSCFLKLAKPGSMDPFVESLTDGLYLPASYAQLLLETLTPESHESVSLGYKNVDRYLSNSLFLSLAKEGWIGSSGVSTNDLRRLVDETLQNQDSLVLAVDSSKETPRERQNRARSRAPRKDHSRLTGSPP